MSDKGGDNAAQAILTTDLVVKQIALESNIDGRRVQIGGMAKGSGMIHPDMATMLGYITCDASVPLDVWQGIVKRAVDRSFNTITVDGDTSTNDAFLGFAAGQPLQSQFWDHLEEGVNIAVEHLAKAIARDGEGATCLIEVEVMGSLTNAEATKIARTICGSSLVKTAIHGNDPNWGRIVAAAGRSGVKIDINDLCLWIGPYQLLKNGEPLKFDNSQVSSFINDRKKGSYLIDDNVQIRLTIGSGKSLGKAWGCDLSNEYIHINADYTT